MRLTDDWCIVGFCRGSKCQIGVRSKNERNGMME